MSARLEARLARLEAREGTGQGLPSVFIVCYGDDDLLIGFRCGDAVIARLPGESVADLERRCEATRPDGRLWLAEYSDQEGMT